MVLRYNVITGVVSICPALKSINVCRLLVRFSDCLLMAIDPDTFGARVIVCGLWIAVMWCIWGILQARMHPHKQWKCLVDVTIRDPEAIAPGSRAHADVAQSVMDEMKKAARQVSLEKDCEPRGVVLHGIQGFPLGTRLQLWVSAEDRNVAADKVNAIVRSAIQSQDNVRFSVIERNYVPNNILEYVPLDVFRGRDD